MNSLRTSVSSRSSASREKTKWHAHTNQQELPTIDGSVKLAKKIEEQVKANGRAELRKGSRFVYISLFIAAVGFGLITYFLMKMSQEKTFESEFQSYARETADIAENNAENTFGQLKTLATALTSIARDNDASENPNNTGAVFPEIVIPHFDLRTKEIADLTGIEMIVFAPFVDAAAKDSWEAHEVETQDWITQDYEYRGWDVSEIKKIPTEIHPFEMPNDYNETRRGFVDDGFMEDILTNLSYASDGLSVPVSQFGPGPVNTSLAMTDLFTHPVFKKEIISSLEYDVPVISETQDLRFLLDHIDRPNGKARDYTMLRSFTLDPVKEDFREGSKTVGYLVGVVPWGTFFRNLLPEKVNGIVVKVVSDCGRDFTYVVNGGKEDWAANGDFHDPKYDDMVQEFRFFWKDHPKGQSRHCHFDLCIFPSDEFAHQYKSNEPLIYALVVVSVCIFMGLLFFGYDTYVQNKQRAIMSEKARTQAVVEALFPPHVGERLLAEKKAGRKSSLNNIMHLTETGTRSKPLADLFPSATVMFADIAGFTAWSSVREPIHVFTLLEALYGNFDVLAKKRRVFKVETIGDCYVACCGLPDIRPEHAMVMAKFAGDCLASFDLLVHELEVELGPDTSSLGLRVGLHTGPVTAGVLRGERSRFQLFGDTVNTTARIESLGAAGRIHLSKETATELEKWNMGSCLIKRDDQVIAKGKGRLSTFWLSLPGDISESEEVSEDGPIFSDEPENGIGSNSEREISLSKKVASTRFLMQSLDKKKERLIDWNSDTLLRHLRQVVARRDAKKTEHAVNRQEIRRTERKLQRGKMVIDEVAEVIVLPNYDKAAIQAQENGDSTELGEGVAQQLRTYVARIAQLYPDNAFHNFEHASHVSMSVSKLLSRIVAPNLPNGSDNNKSHHVDKMIHDHTYGITSDPLTQFACIFSALIHDAGHEGVPNTQLVTEGTAAALRYKNISVAEQNSVDVAWSILMEPQFEQLRATIYTNESELVRFRQLVVNSVMATDIVDKNLKTLRNARWEKAFDLIHRSNRKEAHDQHRKATIVIEHLIQASDVSHTMQHWHIFLKWNENLFREMYSAFLAGRSRQDPSKFWYKGEIGFFDFYIIPLAKKLKECGVFGVSSDEYLNYAIQNRAEWLEKGEEIVEGYLASFAAYQDEQTRKADQPPPRRRQQISTKVRSSVRASLRASGRAPERLPTSTLVPLTVIDSKVTFREVYENVVEC